MGDAEKWTTSTKCLSLAFPHRVRELSEDWKLALWAGALLRKPFFFLLVFPSSMPCMGWGWGLGGGWKLSPFVKSGRVLPVQGRHLPPSGLYLFLRLLANQPLMCQLFIHQNCQTLWISSPLLWLAHSKTLTFSKFCSLRRKGKIAKNSIPANTVTRRYVTGGVAS